MKELIFLNVGGAGTRMGDKTWQILTKEHEINPSGMMQTQSQLYNNETICRELSSGKYTPRNLFIDTAPDVVDQIRAGPRKTLYNPSYSITGKQDAANNYVRGFYTIGRQLSDECQDKFRKLLEGCDHLNGVILNCSISGGTGSGLSNLILERIITNNLQKKPIGINMIVPSPNISDTVVEPYNFVMGLGDLMNIDAQKYVTGFDNQQLYKLCQLRGIEQPGYNEINQLIGKSIAVMTSSFRQANSNSSLSQLITNLIPYKNSFLLAPAYTSAVDIAMVNKAIKSLYLPSNRMNSYRKIGQQTILSTYGVLRGQISHYESLNTLIPMKKQLKFCDWNPTNLKLKTNSMKLKQFYEDNIIEGVMLINSDSCRQLLDKQHKNYDKLYRTRSFIHWYVGEGIDDESVTYGRECTAALQKDYEQAAIQAAIQDHIDYIYE